jgi:hypothetical protein
LLWGLWVTNMTSHESQRNMTLGSKVGVEDW